MTYPPPSLRIIISTVLYYLNIHFIFLSRYFPIRQLLYHFINFCYRGIHTRCKSCPLNIIQIINISVKTEQEREKGMLENWWGGRSETEGVVGWLLRPLLRPLEPLGMQEHPRFLHLALSYFHFSLSYFSTFLLFSLRSSSLISSFPPLDFLY